MHPEEPWDAIESAKRVINLIISRAFNMVLFVFGFLTLKALAIVDNSEWSAWLKSALERART